MSSTESFSVSEFHDSDLYFRVNEPVLVREANGFWSSAIILRLHDYTRGLNRLPFMRQALVSLSKSANKPRWIPCSSSRIRLARQPRIEPILTAIPPDHILDHVLQLLDNAAEYRSRWRWCQADLAECRAFREILDYLNCLKPYPGRDSMPDDWPDVCKSLLKIWFISLLPMLQYQYQLSLQLFHNFQLCSEVDESAILLRKADLVEAASMITLRSSQIQSLSQIVDDQSACLNLVEEAELHSPLGITFRDLIKQWQCRSSKNKTFRLVTNQRSMHIKVGKRLQAIISIWIAILIALVASTVAYLVSREDAQRTLIRIEKSLDAFVAQAEDRNHKQFAGSAVQLTEYMWTYASWVHINNQIIEHDAEIKSMFSTKHDIIMKVLERKGWTNHDLNRLYTRQLYCVQYPLIDYIDNWIKAAYQLYSAAEHLQ